MGFSAGSFRGVSPQEGGAGFAPPGEYLVKLVRAEEMKSAAGNKMVKITLVVQGGPEGGKRVIDRIVFCDSMAGRNKHLLKILDQPSEESESDDGLIVEPKDWENKILRVKVDYEPYQGKNMSKVQQYMYRDEEHYNQHHRKSAKAKTGDKPAPAAAPKPEAPKDGDPDPAAAGANDKESEEEIPF